MRKKRIISGVLASSVVLAATLGGCSLVSTNSAADMNQIIAEVNISDTATLDEGLAKYKDAVGTTKIIKRELVAYYINVGYSYVQNDNYEEVFNMLLDALTENAVLVQYSTMYLLRDKATNANSDLVQDVNALETYMSLSDEVKKYEYLLGGEDSDEVKIAKYSLYSSINGAIDTYEKRFLDDETSSSGSETRATPGGVDTQKENYYPATTDGKLDYKIYTGYEGNLIDDSGAYKDDMLEGSSMETRMRAYNKFISNLASASYDLVDKKTENLRDVENLNYIKDEYVSQLEQRIINKFYDIYEAEQEKLLKDEDKASGAYAFIGSIYNDLLNLQTKNYETESNFTSAMDSMSDTSFILYAPESDADDGKGGKGKYGFVYNILLPFGEAQNDTLKELQKVYADSELDGGYKPQYFVARNKLLENIKTTDQRAAWFNGEKEYAFNASEKDLDYYGKTADVDKWLFFENNIGKSDKYEQLDKYAGKYPYNGSVVKKSDDSYLLMPDELNITDMLDEFVDYVDYVMGNAAGTSKYTKTAGYGENLVDKLYKDEKVDGKDKIDYSNFIYATGKIDLGVADEAENRANLLQKKTDEQEASKQYLALSAVNELQYAYTTDTGVLSQYVGYSIQAGDTNYIKEFEYAAHAAVNEGAGTFKVCAGDYGWHLIYVTYTFDAGNQYTPDWKNINSDGTFENLFYEWIKSNNMSDISSKRRSQIITKFKMDSTVTKYQDRYQNLLDLGK